MHWLAIHALVVSARACYERSRHSLVLVIILMRAQRLLLPALAILLLLLGWWLHQRAQRIDRDRHTATTTPAPSPTPTTGAFGQATASPSVHHRLAGIAVGDVRFVVVEHPDGTSALYRLGNEVPGLGRVRDITEDGATFDTPSGPLLLHITAPPPATATPPAPSVTASSRPATSPTRRPVRARTARESPP